VAHFLERWHTQSLVRQTLPASFALLFSRQLLARISSLQFSQLYIQFYSGLSPLILVRFSCLFILYKNGYHARTMLNSITFHVMKTVPCLPTVTHFYSIRPASCQMSTAFSAAVPCFGCDMFTYILATNTHTLSRFLLILFRHLHNVKIIL
jgi:hypothetical protein